MRNIKLKNIFIPLLTGVLFIFASPMSSMIIMLLFNIGYSDPIKKIILGVFVEESFRFALASRLKFDSVLTPFFYSIPVFIVEKLNKFDDEISFRYIVFVWVFNFIIHFGGGFLSVYRKRIILSFSIAVVAHGLSNLSSFYIRHGNDSDFFWALSVSAILTYAAFLGWMMKGASDRAANSSN